MHRPYSEKTLNCIVNNGKNYNEIIKYIDVMQTLFNNSVQLENEIVC